MGFSPTFPFDVYLETAGHRLLRDALDPAGFLGRRRCAGRASARVAAGGLPRDCLEFHAARTVGTARRYGGSARDLGPDVWPWQYNMIPTFACIALLFSAMHFRGSRTDSPTGDEAERECGDRHDRAAVPHARGAIGSRPDLSGRRDHCRRGHRTCRCPCPLTTESCCSRSSVGGGPARCRQLGIDAASGSVIALLDDDDVWSPTKLARQLAVVDSVDGDHWIVSSRMLVLGPGTRQRTWPRRLVKPGESVAEYLFRFSGLGFGNGNLQTSTLCFPTDLGR